MKIQIEAEDLRSVLAALENLPEMCGIEEAIAAIREALAEQPAQQEPVTWHHPECEGGCIACLIEGVVQASYGNHGLGYLRRHLTSPPASKPWVGLTDEEIDEMYEVHHNEYGYPFSCFGYERAIEAKLKEKNT